MERSGYVQVRPGAREKQYSLVPGPLADLLRPEGPTPWRNTVPLFLALEKIWNEVVAADAAEGIRLTRAHRPDLVIINAFMHRA